MDFWSRLIGGTPKKQAAANNPQQRLARFRKIYNQILQTWHKTASLASDPTAAETVRVSFQRLTSILHEESRSPAPHLCLSFSSSSKVYTAVARIASTAHNESIVREAVAVFAALVDSEEEDFLENGNFSQSLMTFISKVTGRSAVMVVGEDTEAEIVELLFGIAAKIRLQPEILPVWFTTRDAPRPTQQKVDFAGVTQKEDFPLCYQLIDHVHHEGRIGDFARTGLLYVFESASKSQELEQWIVDSDLPTLMASSLGALYSQLSRKLTIIHPPHDIPIILTLSDYAEMKPSTQAESVFSPDFQLHMDTFLSFLAFWQDVLEHCLSLDVRQTLIDHFQVLFLQQLLYPSLLESSDVDGGSAVAVLTYLRRILDALDHPELVHMILHYLLALSDPVTTSSSDRSPLALKRRQSLMLLTLPKDEDDRMNPSLFNLVDLILAGAESINDQTIIAAMRLITVILHKNHDYAVGTLLRVVNVHGKEPHRTVGALNAEMERYLEVAAAVGGESGMDEAYALHLNDMLTLLEIHPCSYRKLTSELNQNSTTKEYFSLLSKRPVPLHQLAPEDPLLERLLKLLQQFFTNNVETNLGLTEAFITLASCAQLRLEGWLSVEPLRYEFHDESPYNPSSPVEDDALRNVYRARREPFWPRQHSPVFLLQLLDLQEQLDKLRAHISDLDAHISNRKQAFRVHDAISEAMSNNPQSQHPELLPGSWTPQIPKHVFEASTPPRSQSPRGRKELLDPRMKSLPPSPSRQPRVGGSALVGSPGPSSRRMSPNPRKPRPQTLMMDVAGAIDLVAQDESLKRRVRFTTKGQTTSVEVFSEVWDAQEGHAVNDRGEAKDNDDEGVIREASLSHVLTNAVILQEFVLQIVAIMQIRGSLFDEVRFA